jgi:predicted nucleic acid-binding Zn finger protein
MTTTAQVSKPQRRGAGWFVPSGTVPDVGYSVEVGQDMVQCTCPSFVHRRIRLGGECQHLRAVTTVMKR